MKSLDQTEDIFVLGSSHLQQGRSRTIERPEGKGEAWGERVRNDPYLGGIHSHRPEELFFCRLGDDRDPAAVRHGEGEPEELEKGLFERGRSFKDAKIVNGEDRPLAGQRHGHIMNIAGDMIDIGAVAPGPRAVSQKRRNPGAATGRGERFDTDGFRQMLRHSTEDLLDAEKNSGAPEEERYIHLGQVNVQVEPAADSDGPSELHSAPLPPVPHSA